MADNRLILGLDLSTSCCGTSLVSCDGDKMNILKVSHVKFKTSKKYKDTELLFYKSYQFKNNFIDKYKDIGLTDVVIEEPLLGSNNIIAASTLLRFNGMVSQSIYEATGIAPQYISSYDARRFAFPDLIGVRKYNRNDTPYDKEHIIKAMKKNELRLFGDYPFTCQKKYIIWNKIVERYPDIEWVYDKNMELKKENFDASDSLTCILGMLNKEKYNDYQNKVLEYNVKDNVITYKADIFGTEYKKTITL